MEHRQALEIKAAERYLLGDLPPADREAFEEHYFGCPECARNVTEMEEFLVAATSVFRDRNGMKPGTQSSSGGVSHRSWPGTALGLLLGLFLGAGMAGYQHNLPESRSPDGSHVFPAVVLGETGRAAPSVIALPSHCPFLGIEVPAPAAHGVGHYELALAREDGPQVFRLNSAPPGPGERIHVLVPAESLPAGWYHLAVDGYGVAGAVEDRTNHRFRVVRR